MCTILRCCNEDSLANIALSTSDRDNIAYRFLRSQIDNSPLTPPIANHSSFQDAIDQIGPPNVTSTLFSFWPWLSRTMRRGVSREMKILWSVLSGEVMWKLATTPFWEFRVELVREGECDILDYEMI